MYFAATRNGSDARASDTLDTGRILVVDDDKAFGGFMIAPLLDKMGQIVASTRRRATSTRPPQAHRGTSNDRQGNGRSTKIELVLYTSSESEKSLKAIRSIRRVLEQYEAADISFAVCDLSGRPSSADEDAVVFTPTLVKRGPGPRTWIVGNIDQPELLVDLLEVSGVDRRKDGR